MSQRGRVKKKEPPELMITSLLDAFTILLIYLIKYVSAQGEVMTVAPNLLLPESSARKEAKVQRVTIAVTKDDITIGGKQVCTIADIEENMANMAIVPPLVDQLEMAKEEEIQMVRIGAALKFEGKVVLQIDKKVPFKVMYKVMASCGTVGYVKMDMAVIRKEEG